MTDRSGLPLGLPVTRIGETDNNHMAKMLAYTVKGNATGASAAPQDLTSGQIASLLNLGSAASLNAGTAANNLLKLTSTNALPALNASALTNLSSNQVSGLGSLAMLNTVAMSALATASYPALVGQLYATSPMAALESASVRALLTAMGAISGGGGTDPSWSSVTFMPRAVATVGSSTDLSTNAQALTLTNVTSGNTSPVNQQDNYWFGFNGLSSLLKPTSPTTGAFAVGTGDFTVEMWAYLVAVVTSYLCTTQNSNNTSTGFNIDIEASGVYVSNNGTIISYGTPLPATTWTHIALTRSGTTMTLWVGGTSVGTATNSTNFTDNSFRIGCYPNEGGGWLNGKVAGVRFTKGVCRYTSSFTPPATPFPTN